MVVFTLRLLASPRNRGEIVQALRSLIGPTQAERGCVACHLQQDADDPNLLTFSEEWQQQADLDRHMASGDYHRLLVVMDMASAPPNTTISEVMDVSALDRIAAARGTRTSHQSHPPQETDAHKD